MSKRIDLLLEKFLNAFKMPSGDTYEVFLNPTKRDIKDVEAVSWRGQGYRFIIDFQKKDVYIFTTEVIHRFVISEFKGKYWNFDYVEYLDKAVATDRYFTGHIDNGRVESDMWRGFEHRIKQFGQDLPYDNFKKMQAYDKSWLKKYGIDPKQLQKHIDKVVDAKEERIKRAS